MAYDIWGNVIVELTKIGKFGIFSEERMQSLIEGMCNNVDYDLKDSRKAIGQLEECSDSKVM